MVANAYAVSSLLPNLIYGLFLGGIIYSIFIPILVERITSHGEEDARDLVNALLTIIAPLMAVVILFAVIFAGPLVDLLTSWNNSSKLSPEEARRTTSLTVLLFRVFVLQIFFWVFGALATGILNAHRRFFLPLFTPVVFNLFVIASLVGYFVLESQHPLLAIYLLAGVPTLGVALVTLALLPAIWRLGYKPRLLLGHPALTPALRLAGPMVLFVVSSILLQAISAHFGSLYNANADLGYAFVVFTLPYGIFVISLETVLMPELSEKYARGDLEGYRESLSFGLRTMAFLIVPSSVVLIVLSRPIVGLLYERARFGTQARPERLRAARRLLDGAPRLLGVLPAHPGVLLPPEHQNPSPLEHRLARPLYSPRLRALGGRGAASGGTCAGALGGQRRLRPGLPGRDAEGDKAHPGAAACCVPWGRCSSPGSSCTPSRGAARTFSEKAPGCWAGSSY